MLQVPQPLALDVGDRDAVDLDGRAVHLIAQADALLERGHQREHLERRARRQPGLGEVEALGVGPAVVGLHAAGLRVDRHHRGAHVRVLAVEVSVTASSAAFCACGSIVVVICRPSVFSVCSLMSNRSSSSLLHLPFDQPVRAGRHGSASLAWSGGTVGGNTCAARSVGDSAPIVTMPSSTQFHRSAAPVGVDGRVERRRAAG